MTCRGTSGLNISGYFSINTFIDVLWIFFTWSYGQISGHSRHSCKFVPPHKSKISCFNNVFLCTFHCTLRKSLYYPHTFTVHTLDKIDLMRFRSRSSIGSATIWSNFTLDCQRLFTYFDVFLVPDAWHISAWSLYQWVLIGYCRCTSVT